MPVPDPSSFSFQSKQVAEYCWIQEFEGRQLSIKTRVFFTPFEFDPVTMNATGKYNPSVFIGGDWQPFIQRVSDAELFANRSALFTNGGEFRYAPL